MKHLPLERYYHPDEFAEMKAEALALGFKHVESAPLVRSSYHARDQVPGAELRRSAAARRPSTPTAGSFPPRADARTHLRPSSTRSNLAILSRWSACCRARSRSPSSTAISAAP